MRYWIKMTAFFAVFVVLTAFMPKADVSTPQELIDGIMGYQMDLMIKRCQKDYGYSDDDMKVLEKELKRYLILCVLKEKKNKVVDMFSKDVDNLWHAFILFTKEYASFCNTYAKRFIHHMPRTDDIVTVQQKSETKDQFLFFVEQYEKVFKEKVNPIWLRDHGAGSVSIGLSDE